MRTTTYERAEKLIKLSKPWFSKICRTCGDTVGDEYMYSYRVAYFAHMGNSSYRTYTCMSCAMSYADCILLNPKAFPDVVVPTEKIVMYEFPDGDPDTQPDTLTSMKASAKGNDGDPGTKANPLWNTSMKEFQKDPDADV